MTLLIGFLAKIADISDRRQQIFYKTEQFLTNFDTARWPLLCYFIFFDMSVGLNRHWETNYIIIVTSIL